MISLAALLGGFVGIVLGLTGAGGSIIAVPLLMLFLHLSTVQAAPIALLAVATSSLAGAILGLRNEQVRYRAAGLIAITGMAFAPIGVWCARHLPNLLLTLIIAFVLTYIALQMLVKTIHRYPITLAPSNLATNSLPCEIKPNQARIHWTLPCARALVFTGIFTGLFSGMLGVGGGFIVVPSLKKFSNLDMQQILPSTLLVIALISSTGVLTALWFGTLLLSSAWPFACGALVGMLISRQMAHRIPAIALQRLFACFVLVVACNLIWKGLHS